MTSAEELLHQVRENEFSLILIVARACDCRPAELGRRVRSTRANAMTPILFVNPDESELGVLEAASLGTVDFLFGPLRPVVIRSRVSILLELPRSGQISRTADEALSIPTAHDPLLWRTTLSSIGDGVIATDPKGLVSFLNAVAEQLTGWTLNEAQGRPLTEVFRIVNETTRRTVENPALRALETGTIVGLANHTLLISRDGTERPIDDSASPIRADDGSMRGAVLVFRDISERKQSEIVQARLAAIVASSDDAIIGKDLDGTIRSWNKGAERIFGYTADEAIGQSITLLLPVERLGEEKGILERLRRGERIRHFDTVRVRKDGQRVDISLSVSPIRDSEGTVTGASKVARDVTEVRKAERALAAARRRTETALQAGEVGTYYWDILADQVTGDRNFVTLFGVLPNERCAAPVQDFLSVIHCDDRERVTTEILRTIETDVSYRSEYRVVSPAGERWLLARGVVERDPSGRAIGWAGVVVDISDRKRAEAAVHASNERFRIVAKATNDAVWDWDMRTDSVWWNDGVQTLFAYRSEEVGLDASWWSAQIHPEDRERVVSGIHTAIDAGRAHWSDEYRFRCANGRYAVVLDRAYAIAEGGRTVRLVGAMQDVTERRLAEDRIRESEARFRTLFEAMDEGYCVVEPLYDDDGTPSDYRYLLVNPALIAHTGLHDVVGKTAREVMPTHESHWIEAYARVATTGEPLRRTDYVADLERWFDVSAFSVGRGQVGVLFADVSDRLHAESVLRSSERQLAEVFRLAPSFMAVLRGPDHVIERVNDSFHSLTGGRDVVGRPIRDALPEIVRQGFVTLLDRVYATGEPYVGTDTTLVIDSSGERSSEDRHLDFVYQPLEDSIGNVTGILVQGIDQTAQKVAEGLIREKDARLKLLVDRARDYAVVIIDRAGNVVEWAGGAESITGFAPADLVGGTAERFFTPEDRAAGVPEMELATALSDGRVEDKRWHLKKDGSQFFADGVMVPLRDDDGSLHGFGKVFRDVTSRKRAEDAVQFLANASASLAELVDYQSTLNRIANLAVGGFAEWCVVDLLDENGQRERLAVTAADLNDKAAYQAFQGDDDVVPQVFRTGQPEVVFDLSEVKTLGATPPTDWIERLRTFGVRSYLSVPLLSHGTVIGAITFLSSSSRRRFGTEELRVARSLAERVTVAIENAQLYRALQEQDRRKDEFLATLAHELRNPLSPVRNGIEILRLGGTAQDDAGAILSMMDRQLGHMTHLVDDLLDVARVSSGKVVLRKGQVTLREVVEAAVETSRQVISTSNHKLDVELPDEPIALNADRTRLVQVLANLLNNSAKYTPAGGRIDVSARREDSEVVLRVVDTGIGIPSEMLPKVFDMFVQVGASLDRSEGGLGIGLTLVRRLVEMHGGSVMAESPGLGQGSVFTVRLPIARGPFAANEGRPAGEVGQLVQSLRIMVVDDNRDAADSLAQLLRIRGHEVQTANDGAETLRLLELYRPHLIVLDLGLPGMSGFEIASRIRENDELSGVTLAALTGWGQEDDRRRTRDAGFDYHLVKPADPEQLERIVMSASNRSRQNP